MTRLLLVIGLLLSLAACAGNQPGPPKLPYRAWYVALVAPHYMDVWVESVDVLDQRGFAYFDVHGGVASYTGKAAGWHEGLGAGKPISNVDLPERIYVRWQSLVEPQTYKSWISIPQWIRDEMVRRERVFCTGAQEWKDVYRDTFTLGLAPGGIVKVWLGGPCLPFREVGRYQAKIEPLGPFQNGKGEYYRDPTPESKAYIDQHGIPYGSW